VYGLAPLVEDAAPGPRLRLDLWLLVKGQTFGLCLSACVVGDLEVVRLLEVQDGMLPPFGPARHFFSGMHGQVGSSHESVLLRGTLAGEGLDQG